MSCNCDPETPRAAADVRPAARPDAGPRLRDAGPRDTGPATEPVLPTERSAPRIDMRGEFLGEPDGPRRLALARQEIAEIERGSGGRSLAFKITLADGTKGYFKPEQTFSAAHWYGEVAAYYLDRELGLGRAIPTIGRRFEWPRLRPFAVGDPRFDELIIEEHERGPSDDTIRGAFVWWVSDGLTTLRLGVGWERWIRQAGGFTDRLTPFQRPRGFADAMAARRGEQLPSNDPALQRPEIGDEPEEPRPRAGEPDRPDRPAELSDMILFDYLIHNVDRWGGNFTNVRTRGPRSEQANHPLVYLDNAAGFSPTMGRSGLMDARLRACQRFRRRTVEAIRTFDIRRYERRLATDPLAPVLTPRQLEALESRRQWLLEHVAATEERYGLEAVYPWD
jgi:hypothetical protein